MRIHTKKKYSLKKKLWIIKQIKKGVSPSHLSLIYSIPRRSIYNWIDLDKQGLGLENKPLGRKPRNINPAFFKIVTKEWHKLRCGCHKLWLELKKQGFGVSERQIQKIYNMFNFKMNRRKRPSQIKFVKYEWPKPNMLWHTDWTTCPFTGKQLIAFIDDHSRFIVHAEYFENATAENTVLAFKNAINKYGKPENILTDNGTQFTPARNPGSENGLFAQFCINNEVKHILGRVHHPQTNGKIERWWGTYKLEYDDRFNNLDEFVKFYNEERLHQGIGYLYPIERFKV